MSAAGKATADAFPEYNYHSDVLHEYWARAMEELAAFQFQLLDGEEIAARCGSIPVSWDGTLDDLPAGMDEAVERAFAGREPNALCALMIVVPTARRGKGVAMEALRAMIDVARRHGLRSLIAPVRPTLKELYPITPIERYMQWRRGDGTSFDPWIRLHERAGGRILRPAPRSVRITGTVAEWERWTDMQFPESGEYWFPHGLAPLAVDREARRCEYWEPNVWMLHEVRPSPPR